MGRPQVGGGFWDGFSTDAVASRPAYEVGCQASVFLRTIDTLEGRGGDDENKT